MNGHEVKTQETPPITRPLAVVLAIFAGFLRLVPHPWNMTPVGALGLYSGGRLRSWHAFVLPILILASTNVLLHFVMNRPLWFDEMPFIYAAILLNVLLGRWLCRSYSVAPIGAAAVLGSVQFFVVTNLGSWLIGIDANNLPYPKTGAGLIECFTEAIPFYPGTFAGDMVYTLGFFGLDALLVNLTNRAGARQTA
ncbi:MAG: DUF6580 family putative transport protein [Gemmataceae bacterium]